MTKRVALGNRTSTRPRRHLMAALLGSSLIVCGAVAMPSVVSAQSAETQSFAIPAQPLASAINTFSRQTGWQVGYSSNLPRNVMTRPINGTMTPVDALRAMLAGTPIDISTTVLSQSFRCGWLLLPWPCLTAGVDMSIDFKGAHFPKSVVLFAVFFYLRYPVSYRDLEEIMAERGVEIDHATLHRWVVRFSPRIAELARQRKRTTVKSWRVDETYIKVHGKWAYFYRAVNRDGQTLDFMLSKHRNLPAARRFFRKVIASNGAPERVVIDKSGANLAGLQAINVILKFTGGKTVGILQVKYLNNILEQDHRFIKRIVRPMMGFKTFHSAVATLAGIEVAHMIRKKQIPTNAASPFDTFAAIAA